MEREISGGKKERSGEVGSQQRRGKAESPTNAPAAESRLCTRKDPAVRDTAVSGSLWFARVLRLRCAAFGICSLYQLSTGRSRSRRPRSECVAGSTWERSSNISGRQWASSELRTRAQLDRYMREVPWVRWAEVVHGRADAATRTNVCTTT